MEKKNGEMRDIVEKQKIDKTSNQQSNFTIPLQAIISANRTDKRDRPDKREVPEASEGAVRSDAERI